MFCHFCFVILFYINEKNKMEESPFYPSGGGYNANNANNGSIFFSIYVEPYLNSYFQTYQNIITLDSMPAGPLRKMVARISSSKLSPFQQVSPFSDNVFGCKFALMRYPCVNGFSIKYKDSFMIDVDLPAILNYLIMNGYVIDTDTTRILQKSGIGNIQSDGYSGKRTLVCNVRFIT